MSKSPQGDKPLVWLHGEVKTPPFSIDSRLATGFLLRRLQQGISLGMPDSRPMPIIGPRCHELRIRDHEKGLFWRVIYRIDSDAIVVAEVFTKKTPKTPVEVIHACQRRLGLYDEAIKGGPYERRKEKAT